METFANFIGGAARAGALSQPNINPSDTNDTIGAYATASADDARDAIAAARQAFPAWSRSTAQTRADILFKAAGELLARRGELGQLLAREEGKLRSEGIGEVVRAAHVLQFFAGEATRLSAETLPSLRAGVGVEATREAVGVVGIITPWNFPIGIPAWKIAPALACGATVVFKPADLTPASAWALVDILNRAGLPPGVLNLVMGRGSVVGDAIVDGVDAVSFTGSVPTGRAIAARAIAGMKKLQLEMGGKNPLVVLDDAPLEAAVECALNGAFYQSGQRCTASSRLIVTKGVHDAFVRALGKRMQALRVGHALDPQSQMGPLADGKQLESVIADMETADREGGMRIGGVRLKRDTPGFYLSPALYTDTTNAMHINRVEVFGPVAAIIRVNDYDEALEAANDTAFGLSAGICTGSLKYAKHFQANAQAGLVMVNLPTAGLDYHAPFGGAKASSYGPREQGQYGIEFFSTIKTAYINA